MDLNLINKEHNILREELQVDENGLNNTLTFSIEKMSELGITDINDFTKGVLDAKNDKDFRESTEDYIKGYKYGKQGKF